MTCNVILTRPIHPSGHTIPAGTIVRIKSPNVLVEEGHDLSFWEATLDGNLVYRQIEPPAHVHCGPCMTSQELDKILDQNV